MSLPSPPPSSEPRGRMCRNAPGQRTFLRIRRRRRGSSSACLDVPAVQGFQTGDGRRRSSRNAPCCMCHHINVFLIGRLPNLFLEKFEKNKDWVSTLGRGFDYQYLFHTFSSSVARTTTASSSYGLGLRCRLVSPHAAPADARLLLPSPFFRAVDGLRTKPTWHICSNLFDRPHSTLTIEHQNSIFSKYASSKT